MTNFTASSTESAFGRSWLDLGGFIALKGLNPIFSPMSISFWLQNQSKKTLQLDILREEYLVGEFFLIGFAIKMK